MAHSKRYQHRTIVSFFTVLIIFILMAGGVQAGIEPSKVGRFSRQGIPRMWCLRSPLMRRHLHLILKGPWSILLWFWISPVP